MRGGESRIPPLQEGGGGQPPKGKKSDMKRRNFLTSTKKSLFMDLSFLCKKQSIQKKKLKKIPKIQAPNCERYTGQRKTPKLGLPWVSTTADDAGPNRVEEGSKGQKRWVSKSGVNVLTIVQWNVLHMCGENWKT